MVFAMQIRPDVLSLVIEPSGILFSLAHTVYHDLLRSNPLFFALVLKQNIMPFLPQLAN